MLIKPNFLAPARPERAMTTHPAGPAGGGRIRARQGRPAARRRQPRHGAPSSACCGRAATREALERARRRSAALQGNREGGHRRAVRPDRASPARRSRRTW
ncbi:MAG: hypothetical protein MZU95_00735 [Desulfomicrobium escambiense]|nr:hypothetical protein [Desulfomicrobium escambiense]